MARRPRVVIIGGGFGGLNAATALKKADVDILLIDKMNHHLFQPLLYQVATAALSPADIAKPIREIVNKQKNVRVILDEALWIDRERNVVGLTEDEIAFDYLIIAVGTKHSYFGNDQWAERAPGLKTLADAVNIREKILFSFEEAEKRQGKENISKYLNFVVVGGGPTGVEMAGAIAQIAKRDMVKDFRSIDPEDVHIYLIEGLDSILQMYESPLNEKGRRALESMGVVVKTGDMVSEINKNFVSFGDDTIYSTNIIWAAGNEAPELLQSLNADLDKAGRVKVEKDCTIPGSPHIFAIGDNALFLDENEDPLPALAPVAIQQGRYAANIIDKNIPPNEREAYRYKDRGYMTTIGRAKAVYQTGLFKISGFIAWLAWVFVHIFSLISFRNKIKVMMEWIWHYITLDHGMRLIVSKYESRNKTDESDDEKTSDKEYDYA